MAKFSVFKDQESLFACPICQAPMRLDQSSLVCQTRHTFNIAKQGFVNFLRQNKGDKHYDMLLLKIEVIFWQRAIMILSLR